MVPGFVRLLKNFMSLLNGATYSGDILYEDPCRAHAMGLMSIAVIIRKKMYFLKAL